MMKFSLNSVKPLVQPLLALLIYFCFQLQIEDWVWAFNEKWTAACNEWAGGLLIIAIILYFVWSLHEKWQKTMLSVCHMGWLVSIVAIYIYYRFIDNTFYFWGFSISSFNVAFLDFCLLPLGQLGMYQFRIWKHMKEDQHQGRCLIDNDEPIDTEDEDLLGYGTIIRSLLADLKTMNLSKHSFSIGVAGEWGIGKSSFFNLFKQILEEDEFKEHSIIVEFNPRTVTDIKDIQQEFFDAYASSLAKYHTGISRDMQRYQDALQLPDNNLVVRLFRLLPSLTVSKSKGVINNVIKEIGKRVYVLIDDFDRLTAEEILEVMKVVDRNGDFRQTIFITAYDKEYVNNVLKNYLKHRKKDAFTDKYFNYEIPLPVQPKEVLCEYVKKLLGDKIKVDGGDAITIRQMQAEWDAISRPIAEQLRTLRHVKRFMNIFLSRYDRVKNDVVFSDFVRVTLLRYYDINCYQALVEGRLTKGEGFLSYNSTILYRADQIEEKLKKYAKWDGSHDIIFSLFNENADYEYDLPSKYRRLQFVKSFPCYFYDYQPNGVYYKQLIGLYDAETDEKAISYMLELIKFDKDKRQYDQAAYVAVENFLRVRPVEELRYDGEAIRLFNLLCYLNNFMGRSTNIEGSLFYMLGANFAKELSDHNIISDTKDFKKDLEDNIRKQIEERPTCLAFVLLQISEDMRKTDSNLNEYLFSIDEIQIFSEWCQKHYLSKLDGITPYNVEGVINLSKVYDQNNGGKISKSAQHEFVSYISLHSEDFVKSLIRVVKTHTEKPKLNIRISDFFDPADFFPCDGVDFSYWVRDNLDNYYTSYILNRLLNEESRAVIVNLKPGDYTIKESDYEQVYSVLKEADELAEEKNVFEAMKKQLANSIQLLARQTGIADDKVRAAILRMKQKGELSDMEANIAERIPAYSKGDFVRIKEGEIDKYKIAEGHAFNLYEISSINGQILRLKDVEDRVALDSVEAVPIDGVHDKKVYYDPIVAASIIPPGGKIPVHKTDYSYFMKKFEDCLDVDKRTFADIVRERDYHFVHEVQQWRREEGDDGLKIYTFGY